jgi:hypothetical protein
MEDDCTNTQFSLLSVMECRSWRNFQKVSNGNEVSFLMDTEYPLAYTDTYTQKVSKAKEVSALMDTVYLLAYTDTYTHAMVQRSE